MVTKQILSLLFSFVIVVTSTTISSSAYDDPGCDQPKQFVAKVTDGCHEYCPYAEINGVLQAFYSVHYNCNTLPQSLILYSQPNCTGTATPVDPLVGFCYQDLCFNNNTFQDYCAPPTPAPSYSPAFSTPSITPTYQIPKCRPGTELNRKKCQSLNKKCKKLGVPMKWTGTGCVIDSKRMYDGGCQCAGYCGHHCPESCNADFECYWNFTQQKCFNELTGLVGKSINRCYGVPGR